MPGTLRRRRDDMLDRSLLIYLEGRFPANDDADRHHDDDDDVEMTSSSRRRQPEVDDQRCDTSSSIEARWSAVVAAIDVRRRQQRRAGAVFESAVARAAGVTPGGDGQPRCSVIPTTAAAAAAATEFRRCRRRRSRRRRRTRSEDNLIVFAASAANDECRAVAAANGRRSTTAAVADSAGLRCDGCSSDGEDGGLFDRRSDRRQRRRGFRRTFRRRRSSWESRETFDGDVDDDGRKLSSCSGSGTKPEVRSTAAAVAAASSGGLDPTSAAGVKKADSFDSGIDTKTDITVAARRSVLRPSTVDQPSADDALGTFCGRQATETATELTETGDIDVGVGRCSKRTTCTTRAPLTDAEVEFELVASQLVDGLLAGQQQRRRDRTDGDGREDGSSAESELREQPSSRDELVEEPGRHDADVDELIRALRPEPSTTAIHYMNGLFDDVERPVATVTSWPATVAAPVTNIDDEFSTSSACQVLVVRVH